jgi:hypothetical protein
MLYWECKRRLVALQEFRMQAVDYFENITYAGWMAGGAPLPMNEPAQKARHKMNRVLGDVLLSITRMGVPHVVNYQPPPRLGGYAQNVDIILNIFCLWEFQIGSERVFDTVDRAIGTYERECKKLFLKLFNPLYWLGMLAVQFLRIPSKLRGTTGNDAPSTDPSLFGSMRQSWAGWNRTDKLTLLTVVVAVIAIVAAVMIPELRLMLHLDKPVAATVEPSPTQTAPAQTTPPVTTPVQSSPERSKPTPKPKGTTPPALSSSTVINAQGGIPIVDNHGTVNNPTVNNFAPPQRTLTPEQRTGLANLLRQPGSFSVVVRHAGNNFEAQTYAESLASALKDAGWKVNDNPGLMFETKQGVGLKILVRDLQKPPIGAVLLQTSLKQVGLDADGSAQEVVPEGETWLYVGVHP